MSLVEIESREALARTLLSRIDLLELNPENAAETPADIPRAEEIRTWLDRWRTALLERNSLLSTHTPKHPAVLAKDNLVALYRAETLDALKRAKTTAISNHALATEQAKALRMKKEEHIRMAAELEMKVVEGKTRLAALERSRDAADQAYRGVLARIQDARMAADENTATVKIVERATVPLQPFQPSPFRTLALALLLGLAGGLALITATDYLEDRVVGPEDLEGRGIPIMAVVPRVRNASRADIATATIRQHFSEVVEGFAGLGTMMDSPQHKEHSQIILVASSIPGEGKTVTSCNLAAILAKKGRRVLLVDFDLRRPRLAGIFPIPPSERPDMLPFQSDKTQLTKLPYTVAECPNLDVIASRPMIDRNPAMTLGTMAQHLVSWASSNYDHIVLDAPPLGLVSDTLALAPLADLTLVMARSGVSRKRLTWHTINRFWDSGIRNIALVINDFDISKRLYGGHSPYYHYQQHYKTYIPVGAGELKKGARQS